ncbi:hypothetical protein V8G54_011701 [Vigna mungo]|uniref:Integrase catalytic domain-containing protein n=1 Tax=Vigna mungo TaxID=3915 RepID=A0AAQ3NQJ7_VIGMU
MEGKYEGRLKVVENQVEALGIIVDGLKAETTAMRQDSAAIRQDLQEVMRILVGRNRDHEGASDGSQSSVNGDRRGRREEENGGRATERTEGQFNWRKKVELPVFEGTNPLNWINRAERFFELHGVMEEEKVRIAYVSMEGSVGYWYQFWREKERDHTWEGLKCALIGRFVERSRGTIFEKLAANRQTGTVDEYIRDFEIMVEQTKGVTDEQLLGYFLAGLQDNVRDRTVGGDANRKRCRDYIGRNEDRGWKCESTTDIWGRIAGAIVQVEPIRNQGGRTTITECRIWEGEGSLGKSASAVGGETMGRGVRNLPYHEYVKRREEGRCFRCGGQFSPGHRCPERSLRVTILGEDEEEDLGETKKELENERLELSPLSTGGMTQPRTMKLQGSLGDRVVLIMVDNGANHSFISKALVEELQLEVNKDQTHSVCLGDGQRKQTHGCCQGIMLQLGGVEIAEQYHVFELGGVDVILGVDWLAKLGEVVTNWSKLTMSFKQGGREVIIKGDPTLAREVIALATLFKIMEVESVAVMWGRRKGTGVDGEVARRVFLEPHGLPPERGMEHKIILKEGISPVNVRPYRYPHLLKGEIEKQVEEIMRTGIIRHFILVKKKDGSWRFCIDYRALNRATIPDKFPIPVIEELLDELRGAKYFSKIDLKARYHQIRMGGEDIQKTAFRTHQGHYEFLVMPFGLTNAPATFQSAMNGLLRSHLRKFIVGRSLRACEVCIKYVAATSVGSQSQEKRIWEDPYQILGPHYIRKWVEAIIGWEEPKNIKALRGFLGLTIYYWRFLRNYGKLARPLTDMLKKGNFAWTNSAREAMEKLKIAITTAPVLALPDFTQPFHVECDASGVGVGAVLTQNRRPIAFFSKALSEGTLSKSIYEKELMALVLAIQHWWPYVIGQKFLVHSNQRSYDFDILYKAGAMNKVADALSRKGLEATTEKEELDKKLEEKELRVIARPYWKDFQEILEEVKEDEELKKIVADITGDPDKHSAYTLEGGRLHYKGRLVLSAKSKWISTISAEMHTSSIGGHSGVYRTYRRVVQSLYWKGMKKAVTNDVAQCVVCQQHKYLTASPQGLLQPLRIPQAIWEEISMDFIVKLPKSKGYDAVLVVVDRLSKYSHFIPLKHPYTTRAVAEAFVKEVVKLHGVPKSIVSAMDPLFLTTGDKPSYEYCLSPGVVQTNEGIKPGAGGYLRCFCSEQPKGWSVILPWAEYWYNTSYQGAAKCTPFETVGEVAFRLLLPDTARIHPVFHASQLKIAIGAKSVAKGATTDLQMEGPTYWPIRVLDRKQQQKEETSEQVLIEWNEGGVDGATWEDRVTIQEQFPEFNLGDKVDLQDGGNVRGWKVYVRRKKRDMVNTRMESRLDVVDKMMQELIQDKDRHENQSHERFQRLEDMIWGLTDMVESLSCSTTKGDIVLNGLKEDIKAEVKLYEPSTLLELMMSSQKDSVAADPTKVEVMINWPVPKIAKALRGFLGLLDTIEDL